MPRADRKARQCHCSYSTVPIAELPTPTPPLSESSSGPIRTLYIPSSNSTRRYQASRFVRAPAPPRVPVSPCPRVPVSPCSQSRFSSFPSFPSFLFLPTYLSPQAPDPAVCQVVERSGVTLTNAYGRIRTDPRHATHRLRMHRTVCACQWSRFRGTGAQALVLMLYAPPGWNAVVRIRYCLAARPELHLAQDRSFDLQARLSSKVEPAHAVGGRRLSFVSTRTSGRGHGGPSALWYRYPQQRCGTGTGTAVRLLRTRLLTECCGLTAFRTGRVHLYGSDDGGDPVSAYGAVRTGYQYQHQCLRVSTNNEKREKSVLTVSRPGTIHCDSNLGTWRAITCP